MVSGTAWAIPLATAAGLLVAHVPLVRFPDAGTISSAILIGVVAVLASQSHCRGIAAAPLYLLCGVTLITMACAAAGRLRQAFPLRPLSVRQFLAGTDRRVAATPVLAVSCSPGSVTVGILLALPGYILGTGFGQVMASIFSAMAT